MTTDAVARCHRRRQGHDGVEAFSSQIRQEPDVRQVQVGSIGQTGEVSVATQNQFMVGGPVVASPVVASPVMNAGNGKSGDGKSGNGKPGDGKPGGGKHRHRTPDRPASSVHGRSELFFAESPQHVEQAKAMCRDCRARMACLTGASLSAGARASGVESCCMRGAIVPSQAASRTSAEDRGGRVGGRRSAPRPRRRGNRRRRGPRGPRGAARPVTHRMPTTE